MRFWRKYASIIRRNCASPANSIKDLVYWRNNLFASIIIYLLPLCFIALIPGVYFSIASGRYVLAATDIFTAICMFIVAFLPAVAILMRKLIYIVCFYILSCVLLYYLGLQGPGLIYLQATAVFSILIFPARYTYWPAILNTVVCILFATCSHYRFLPWDQEKDGEGAWIAISSNLVFLSFLSSALIPRLFLGMQETIKREKELSEQLIEKQRSLHEAAQAMEYKNKELEQFAFVVSHDLQEPLRMITGFLGRLDRKYSAVIDEKGKEYIHYAVDGAERMMKIITELLEFSRVGKTADIRENVNMNELLSEILILLSNQIRDKGAIVQYDFIPDFNLNSYKSPLRQVIQNLISNGLKYSDEGRAPFIQISAREREWDWEFSVSDNGIGIAGEYFDKIFIIFQRLHGKAEYSGGTGIGLAVTKKIVENIGGQIWLESKLGQGSTFYFTIPKDNIIL